MLCDFRLILRADHALRFDFMKQFFSLYLVHARNFLLHGSSNTVTYSLVR